VQARFGRFELDEANGCLLRDGVVIAVAPTPFAVLCALARQPGALLSKHALLDEVWGHQFVSESVLKTAISELRMLLEDDARQPRFIETVSRRGYRFIAQARTVAPMAQAETAEIAAPQPPSLIGRSHALARLRRAWDAARDGRCALVWVAGEPGIGKTTLIERFIAGLGDVACVRGQCVEHDGSGEPYLPVLEALAELCRIDTAAPALLRAVAPSWLLQLPWLSSAAERDALRRELGDTRLDRMLRELSEVFDRYTERRPLLLVTEDLHWSDRATIQLIDYIARRRNSSRLLWVASFRPADLIALDHPLNRVRRELRLHALCEEIVLDPFAETEVAEYVSQRSPSLAGDDAFIHALHERTDGVPLYVSSIMREVMARSASGCDEAGAAVQLANAPVPDNLISIIDHYIARLGGEQRMLLSAAAVCGLEFRASTVADALERDGAWVGETCEELARAQLWLRARRAHERCDTPEHPYSFRNALFRQVLYQRTPPSARAHLHRKVGAALERERIGARARMSRATVGFDPRQVAVAALW
jgi:DNA-binding winged helix-turn-helix (wHTH) protein